MSYGIGPLGTCRLIGFHVARIPPSAARAIRQLPCPRSVKVPRLHSTRPSSEQRRCRKATNTQHSPHRFAALQCARISDGSYGSIAPLRVPTGRVRSTLHSGNSIALRPFNRGAPVDRRHAQRLPQLSMPGSQCGRCSADRRYQPRRNGNQAAAVQIGRWACSSFRGASGGHRAGRSSGLRGWPLELLQSATTRHRPFGRAPSSSA
jgi:hypothetical protein